MPLKNQQRIALVNDNSWQKRSEEHQQTHAPANSVSVYGPERALLYAKAADGNGIFSFRRKTCLTKMQFSNEHAYIHHESQLCPTFSSPRRVKNLEANTTTKISITGNQQDEKMNLPDLPWSKKDQLSEVPVQTGLRVFPIALHGTTKTSTAMKIPARQPACATEVTSSDQHTQLQTEGVSPQLHFDDSKLLHFSFNVDEKASVLMSLLHAAQQHNSPSPGTCSPCQALCSVHHLPTFLTCLLAFFSCWHLRDFCYYSNIKEQHEWLPMKPWKMETFVQACCLRVLYLPW